MVTLFDSHLLPHTNRNNMGDVTFRLGCLRVFLLRSEECLKSIVKLGGLGSGMIKHLSGVSMFAVVTKLILKNK